MTGGVALGRSQAMDAGPLTPLVQEFLDRLSSQGYASSTILRQSTCARHFAVWLFGSGIALSDVDEETVEQFMHHHCRCTGSHHLDRLAKGYRREVRRFVGFLAAKGVVPTPSPPAAPVIDRRVTAFQNWLKLHRGASPWSINQHGTVIMRLLPALGPEPAAYDAALVRRVILEESRRGSRYHIRSLTSSLRLYLRFLASRGECHPDLDHAIPTAIHWRLSALPRYLPAADVERLIASCDPMRAAGLRDRAILLLLARLGLRSGDIWAMRLDDIEWENGTLRVRGKGRREVRLPLPQDAGDALLDYLTKARPHADTDRVFLRVLAPFRPHRRAAFVTSVVGLALARAGITDAPTHGAHMLRHSAATAMLRAGASLEAIGTVLRHRSVDTTAHYAKVDRLMLSRVAQPWPGDPPC